MDKNKLLAKQINSVLKKDQQASMLPFFLQILKPYKWWMILMLQAPILGTLCPFIYNYAIKLAVDNLAKTPLPPISVFILPVCLFISADLFVNLVWRMSNYATLKSQPFIQRDIIIKSFDYVLYHSYQFFQDMPSGTIISKIKGIVDGYDALLAHFHYRLFCLALQSMTGIIFICFVNIYLGLIFILWALVTAPVMYKMSRKLEAFSTEEHNAKHNIIGLLADNVSNIFTLFSFATRKIETAKITNIITDNVVPKAQKTRKYDIKLQIIIGLFYVVICAAMMVSTIYLRYLELLTLGDVAFIFGMGFIVLDMSWRAICEINDYMKSLGDLRSSFSIIQTPQDIIDRPDATELRVNKGEIMFKNLYFGYENNNEVFTNLNLHIKAGQKIGIVGHSGAGKSTLIALLLKNFKVTQGEIIIDGQNINDATSDSLRSQISLIPQDIMLFHRSIAENIGYASDNASQEEIGEAAKAANIHEFINSLPEKYDTLVGERGIKLSGGQRQRIAIARAILKKAPILILDEATSSLDSQTEQEIQKSIHAMLEANNATVIAIAHRLSTIRHMDRIVVMDQGKIIEDGSFAELIQKENGKFRELWNHQVNGMIV